MQGKPPYCKTVSALQTLIRSQAVIDNISYTYTIRACVEYAHIEQHLGINALLQFLYNSISAI